MKNLKRSIVSLVVVLLLAVSSFIPSFAATGTQPATYSSEYNSGQRDVVCTTLSGTSADEYYTGYEYDTLSELSASALQSELNELMTDTHTYIASYDDCHYKADRSDCQNGDGSVSLIYTNYSATMSQWNGWNREHVWPKSLAGDSTTGGGADMHHIRPSDQVVNSTRNNKKYGNVDGGTAKYGSNPASGYLGGYYDSTYFEPLDNVKGDVARICLYVMVRWGEDWNATSITQVFESVDVLLEWCELDPVDTWEMGRNEVVEDIQGNRNVFIDYPEYAWLIFGREVPADMTTPSGEASDGEGTSSGSSSNGSTSSGNTTVTPDTGVSSTPVATTTETASVTISSYASANGWTNQSKHTSVVVDENITATASSGTNTGKYYTSGTNWRLYQSESAELTLTAAEGCTIKSVKITYTSENTGVLKYGSDTVSSGSVLYVSGSSITLSVGNSGSATNGQARITAIEVTYTKAASCSHSTTQTVTTPATCTQNGSEKLVCKDCGETISTTSIPATGHENTTISTVNATCTENGSTTVKCTDCGATVSSTSIPATGHNYVDGTCSSCGAESQTYSYSFVSPTGTVKYTTTGSVTMLPAPTYAGYTFVGWSKTALENASTTKPTTLYQPGTTQNISADTTFYAVFSYTKTVEGASEYVKTDLANIKSTDKVVITMTKGSVVYALPNNNGTSTPGAITITVSGNKITAGVDSTLLWNISNSGGNLTIYPNGTTSKWLYCTNSNSGVRVGTDSNKTFTIDSSSGYLKHTGTSRYVGVYTTNPDWRCYTNTTGNTAGQTLAFYVLTSSTYYVTFEASECEHTNTTTATVNATCTTAGSTTVTCNYCDEVISTTTIPATGHQNTTKTTVDATCTTEGSITVKCKDCGETISTEKIPALNHIFEDGTCTRCGEDKPSDPLGLDSKEFYIAAIRSSGNYWYMTNDLGTASTKRYTAINSESNTLPDYITNKDTAYVFLFEYNENRTTYYIYTYVGSDVKYLGYTSGNSGTLVDKASAVEFAIKAVDDGKYNISFTDNSRYLELNLSNAYFAFYTGTQIKDLALIPVSDEVCEHSSTTKTMASAPTCTEDGKYTIICNDCGNALPAEVIPALGHDLVDGICTRGDYATPPSAPVEGGWTLVTDVSDLKPGDQIIIVSKNSAYALSTNQKDNNRGQASVSKDGNTVVFGSDVQILTLMAGNVDGTFAFYTGSGYLYAASSSNNYLRTETNLSNNSSWRIVISGDGTATVTAQGSNTRNLLRYNSSSSIFSCYSSGQGDIQIYKLEQASSESAELYAASMTIGSNLAMNFYVSGAIGSDYHMTFTVNGTVYESASGKQSNGYLVFTFANIPPQMMGDTITAKLYKSDSDTALDEVEISVKEYAEKVIELYPDNEKLMNLIADMLKYGAAAQEYIGYKVSELVTDGIDLTGKGSTADPTTDDNHRSMTTEEGTEIDKSVYSFTAAGVRFDFDNKIYVKFKATGDANISLKCNGKYVAKEDLGNGTYIFYTDGIDAYSFDEVYTFELYVDNVLHQTLTYSVNSYAYAKFTDEQTTAVDELALALYRYGLSAKEYTGR